MRRRALLAATAGTLGLAGCLSGGEPSDPKTDRPATDAPRPDASPTDALPSQTTPDEPPTSKTTPTPVRRTAARVEASFRVVDSYGPTGAEELTASADFEADRVVVTGAMDPAGCREPVLRSVAYDEAAGRVRLVVATESPWGPTATVECGNAAYEYRCVATVESGSLESVEVVHSLADREDRMFVLESG